MNWGDDDDDDSCNVTGWFCSCPKCSGRSERAALERKVSELQDQLERNNRSSYRDNDYYRDYYRAPRQTSFYPVKEFKEIRSTDKAILYEVFGVEIWLARKIHHIKDDILFIPDYVDGVGKVKEAAEKEKNREINLYKIKEKCLEYLYERHSATDLTDMVNKVIKEFSIRMGNNS